MLTRDQLAEFDRLGFVRLSGVFAEADAARMRERVWAALAERYDVRQDAPQTWTAEQPRHLQALTRAGVFDALGAPVLTGAVDDLLAPGAWQRPDHWGSPLITFPRDGGAWDVPHAPWHIDWPARGSSHPLFGLKVLAFLAPSCLAAAAPWCSPAHTIWLPATPRGAAPDARATHRGFEPRSCVHTRGSALSDPAMPPRAASLGSWATAPRSRASTSASSN